LKQKNSIDEFIITASICTEKSKDSLFITSFVQTQIALAISFDNVTFAAVVVI
jgi:hypothetical protein